MISDDELQANADATLPDFYGPTKWPVEILVPTKELAEMRDELARLKAANERLTQDKSWLEGALFDARQAIDRLQAELAAKEIRWTDALPTTTGYWWYRHYNVNPPQPVRVWYSDRQRSPGWKFALFDEEHLVVDAKGQWSDKPISRPDERTG